MLIAVKRNPAIRLEAPMGLLSRRLLLAWLCWHLFVMSVDIAKHVERMLDPSSVPALRPVDRALAAWAGLRFLTEPYQWRIGLHQNWSMFVPNPRLNTSWLEVEGERPDGSRIPLPLVVGEPSGPIWRYARAGKHERNALGTHRKALRMAYTRYYCRTMAARGEPLARVHFTRVARRTPPPAQRGRLPRERWPVHRTDLGGWNCPR